MQQRTTKHPNPIKTRSNMIRLIILPFTFLLCMCMPSNAQNIIEDDSNPIPIHLKNSWGDSNKEGNKDLAMQPLVYNGNHSLIIIQDYPSQYDGLYIISPSGKTILYRTFTSSSQPKQTISLQGIRPGTYTLYLYEGDRFWYGTFTIE